MDTNAAPRKSPSLTARIVWVVFCFIMYAWAILGPISVVVGTLSFYVDSINYGGETTQQKLSNMGAAGVVGAIGLCFAWLRYAEYLRFGDENP